VKSSKLEKMHKKPLIFCENGYIIHIVNGGNPLTYIDLILSFFWMFSSYFLLFKTFGNAGRFCFYIAERRRTDFERIVPDSIWC